MHGAKARLEVEAAQGRRLLLTVEDEHSAGRPPESLILTRLR